MYGHKVTRETMFTSAFSYVCEGIYYIQVDIDHYFILFKIKNKITMT